MTHPRHLSPTIIREYDIRGVAGENLVAQDAYAIGRTYASMVTDFLGHAATIAIARDGRLSSTDLSSALKSGILDAGATVHEVGVGPTPMLYFAVYHFNADAGIMLTGSHNPKTHNGMKFMLGRAPFYGEQLRELARRAALGEWHSAEGTLCEHDISDAYVKRLASASRPPAGLRLAWDAGNGAAGAICEKLSVTLKDCEHHLLYTDIDGNFPNHHPDPSVPENLADLATTVLKENCALGLAFDGDGDRLGAVDALGRPINSDHLLMLLSRQVLCEQPGATIIADVKTSQRVFDDVTAHSGNALMWMTGHSHIKVKMKQTEAAFAGEASGHLFFADRYDGYDDGLYAALRLIELAASINEPLSALIDRLPNAYSTPELRIEVKEARKFAVIDEIRARLNAQGEKFLAIDGVRMQTSDGWWLIRASNTQAAIIARAESATQTGLARLVDTLQSHLDACGVACEALKG